MPSKKDLIELSDEEKEGLRAAAQIVELEKYLKDFHEALEMLEIRFTVEESIEEAQYLEEKDKYLKNVEKTKKTLGKLRTSEKKAEILALIDNGRQLRNRREKLTTLLQEKKISEATYSKMDSEYQTQIDEVEQKIASEIMRLEKIKEQLENAPYPLWLEEAFARKAVGELTETEYEKTVAKIKKKQTDATEILNGITALLTNLE